MPAKPPLVLEESYLFGLWPKRLLVFEDRIEVHSPGPLDENIEFVGYDAVERVVLHGGTSLSNLLIHRRRQRPILLRGADPAAAEHARKLIQTRI